jgi:hypothetical protein
MPNNIFFLRTDVPPVSRIPFNAVPKIGFATFAKFGHKIFYFHLFFYLWEVKSSFNGSQDKLQHQQGHQIWSFRTC